MRISRYLDAKAFLDAAKTLKVLPGPITEAVLERLESQRSLIPRLRLHYPDSVERRWWAENHEELEVGGEHEADGARYDAARALETARRARRWEADPTSTPHPLDDPEERFLPFMEHPAERPFAPWESYRVAVQAESAEPLYTTDTVVTFYSSWQLLQYAEVAAMGITSLMNLCASLGWPSAEAVAAAPQWMSFLPMQAMRGFETHRPALDAMVWFAEEAQRGYDFATRTGHARRMISPQESAEIMRTRLWAAEQARTRHGVDAATLLAANRFLCEQWAHWEHEGRPLIAGAYKMIAAQGVRLACLTSGQTIEQYRATVGQAGGYIKPILDVMWPNWALEQRDYARRVLVSYRREGSLLRADFSDALVDRFLDFVEAEGLHGFYWRMESFHRHSFEGNDHSVEGLKGDVQGMAVIVEHIASALGGTRLQLSEKFKQLWDGDPVMRRLLRDNAVMRVGDGRGIDLDWFEARNVLDLPEQIAADLAMTYAIRGGAHHAIEEENPLKLERLMLILLRAAVRTFAQVRPSMPPSA